MNYKLLKDLPDVKAGATFQWDSSRHKYKLPAEVLNANEVYSCFRAEFVEDNPTWFSPITNPLSEIIEEEFRLPQGDMMLSDNTYHILNSEAKTTATKAAKRYANSLLIRFMERIENLKSNPETFQSYQAMELVKSEIKSLIKETE